MGDDQRATAEAGRGFRTITLVCAAGALALLTLALPPIHDLTGYHAFADQRPAVGIAHFCNTASNLTFVAAGFYGLVVLARLGHASLGAGRWPYIAVFAGAVLVGLGSMVYHQRPDDATLFWDRLPMVVVFAGVLAAGVSDRVSASAGAALLLPLFALGLLSVEIWRRGAMAGDGDLRLYVLVQYGSTVVLLLTLGLFRARHTHGHLWWWALACYGVAKVFELADGLVWQVSRGLTGGHALKHVAAACALLVLAEMLRRRTVKVRLETRLPARP